MTSLRSLAPALVWLAIVPLAHGQDNLVRRNGSNERYRPGDWVSYGVTRFVTSIAAGTEEVYFGTTGGITRYDLFHDRWNTPITISDGLAAAEITVVAFDAGTGFLWCGTAQGISYRHPSSNRWTNLYNDELGLSRLDRVVSIGIGDTDVWFETSSRVLLRGNKFGGGILRERGEGLRAGSVTWFGARAPRPLQFPQFVMNGGFLFDPRGVVQDFHLRDADVTVAVNDGWGHMWLGTWGLGALKADLQVERAETLEFGLTNPRVDALAITKDGFWIGGLADAVAGGGITRWDSRRNEWEYFEARYNREMTSDEVRNFALAGDNLFCATQYGVGIYDQRRNRWRRVTVFDGIEKEHVYDVALDTDYLWVASEGGLNRVTLKTIATDSVEVIEIDRDNLHLVPVFDLEKANNLLWAATAEGAYVYDTFKGVGGFVSDIDGPRSEVVTAASTYGNEIWFGTLRSIEAYDISKKAWLTSPARQIFIPHPVNCLVADSAVVWAGTDSGVMRYNRRTQDWRQYTTDDGLMDNHVNAIALDGDLVWFGTNGGLTAFRWRVAGRID